MNILETFVKEDPKVENPLPHAEGTKGPEQTQDRSKPNARKTRKVTGGDGQQSISKAP